MFQPVCLFIGLRYLRGHSHDRFGRFVAWLSAIGITLGVMALITVLSVMNGFEQQLQKSTLNLMPQAVVTASTGSLDPSASPLTTKQLSGVTYLQPFSSGEVVLQSAVNVSVALMLGETAQQREPLFETMTEGSPDDLQPGSYKVVLGKLLAESLKVQVGDKIRIMVPSVSQFTPVGRIPAQRVFTVSGLYQADSDEDGYQILVNQQDASRLLHYKLGEVSGWRLWLKDPLNVDTISQQSLPAGLVWKDWRERKGELFQAVKMEKHMMGLLLGLIVGVAAFNIITSLGLVVMEKQAEVAILLTMGLRRSQILCMFMIQGASTGVLGSICGAVAGCVLASQLNNLLPVLGLMLDGGSLPVTILPMQILMITLSAMLLSIAATIYPSYRAATVQPSEALRYE